MLYHLNILILPFYPSPLNFIHSWYIFSELIDLSASTISGNTVDDSIPYVKKEEKIN